MPDRDSTDEVSSWLESRRLIVAQLRSLDTSIRDLSSKIDKQAEEVRIRAGQMSEQSQKAISDINVRIAMLEVSSKIWGGTIGLVAGAIGSGIVQAVFAHAFH